MLPENWRGAICKTWKAIPYILNIAATGCFFNMAGIAYQNHLWRRFVEFDQSHYALPQMTSLLKNLFCGYNSNYAFYDISLLFWLAIVFATLLSWWQRKEQQQLFVRVLATTWFAFTLYLSFCAFFWFCLDAPYCLLLNEVHEGCFPAIISALTSITLWFSAVFLTALIARNFLDKRE